MMVLRTCLEEELKFLCKYSKRSQEQYIYTAWGNSLNLAVQDTCRSIKIMSDTFDTVLELSKAIKYSAEKKAMFQSLKQELSPPSTSLRPLCPTWWTLRVESLRSIIVNCQVIQCLMDNILQEYSGVIDATQCFIQKFLQEGT